MGSKKKAEPRTENISAHVFDDFNLIDLQTMDPQSITLGEAEALIKNLTASVAILKARKTLPAPVPLYCDENHRILKDYVREPNQMIEEKTTCMASIGASLRELRERPHLVSKVSLTIMGCEVDLPEALRLRDWLNAAEKYYAPILKGKTDGHKTNA